MSGLRAVADKLMERLQSSEERVAQLDVEAANLQKLAAQRQAENEK